MPKHSERIRKPTHSEADALRMIARTRLVKMYREGKREPIWAIDGACEISNSCAQSLIRHGWVIAQRDGLSMFDESQTYVALRAVPRADNETSLMEEPT